MASGGDYNIWMYNCIRFFQGIEYLSSRPPDHQGHLSFVLSVPAEAQPY